MLFILVVKEKMKESRSQYLLQMPNFCNETQENFRKKQAKHKHVHQMWGVHLLQISQPPVGSERHSQLLRPFIADRVIIEAVDVCLRKAAIIPREK